MLGFHHHRCTQRGAATLVAMVLWLASLAPLGAQWLASSAAACCRTKCCCHRAKGSTSGPAISNRGCAKGCGLAAFGPAGGASLAPAQAASWVAEVVQSPADVPEISPTGIL